MKSIILSVPIALLAAVSMAWAVAVQSPGGSVRVGFDVKTVSGQAGVPVYQVSYKGEPVLLDSRLGLSLSGGGGDLAGGFAIQSVDSASVDSTWKPLYGQWSAVRDRFNQATVTLREIGSQNRLLQLTFRAYDEGAAFCYTVPAQSGIASFTLVDERTEFRFTGDHPLWANTDRAQSLYQTLRISQIHQARERPLTLAPEGGPFISLAEARMVDYARTRIGPGGALTLKTALAGNVAASAPYSTPWRVIFLADRAVDLLNRQYLIENLNPPNRIADPSWIKPGKAMRVTCSDETCARSYIDFGERMGLQYLHWDAGWYGPERDAGSDPARVVWPIDIAAFIRDAKARGLGLFLYVNQMALTRQLDEILPLYRSWGISGIKYGFVDVGPQAATDWLHEAVRKSAANNLMVDIHDEYVPTGFSRTYPNLLTQEGIGGDEIFPTPEQTLTFLFGRMLAGAADHTVCYFDGRVLGSAGWTRAYQLAKPIVFYSPLQYLFWYDTPTRYGNQPELELWRAMPTVWDDTRALQGEIGSHIVMARRSGSEWYLGSMTAEARTLQIPLSFLDGNKWYMAHVYVNGSTGAQVRIARYLVHAGFSLKAVLPRAGGQSVRLTSATAQEIEANRGRKPSGWQDDIAVYPDTDPGTRTAGRAREAYAAAFKAEDAGDGRVRLFLPPGTSAWQVRSLQGALFAEGSEAGSAMLSGLRPGLYHASAATPGGRIGIRFAVGR
jgi:alpha-glucosidase